MTRAVQWARETKVGNLSSVSVGKATDMSKVMGKAAGREARIPRNQTCITGVD